MRTGVHFFDHRIWRVLQHCSLDGHHPSHFPHTYTNNLGSNLAPTHGVLAIPLCRRRDGANHHKCRRKGFEDYCLPAGVQHKGQSGQDQLDHHEEVSLPSRNSRCEILLTSMKLGYRRGQQDSWHGRRYYYGHGPRSPRCQTSQCIYSSDMRDPP